MDAAILPFPSQRHAAQPQRVATPLARLTTWYRALPPEQQGEPFTLEELHAIAGGSKAALPGVLWRACWCTAPAPFRGGPTLWYGPSGLDYVS